MVLYIDNEFYVIQILVIILCGDYYLSGYFRWSDPSRQQMLLEAGHTKLQGFLKKTICRESEDSRDMQKHSYEVGLQVDDRHIWWFHSNHEMWIQNKYSVEYSLDDLMECTALVCYNDMLAEEIYHDLSQKRNPHSARLVNCRI